MMKFTKIISIAVCFFLLTGLTGCSIDQLQAPPIDASANIWVVTEETVTDGMNYQVNSAITQFTETYKNVTINLEILPTDKTEKAKRLDVLREQISAGNGPDIFLLPTTDVLVLSQPKEYTYQQIEPLFSDVEIAMRNGYFADLSLYYDADIDLETASLNTAIMDAGVIDGARYILPLRYNLPVIYVFEDKLNEYDISFNFTNATIEEWMDYVISQGDSILACGAEYASSKSFSNLIDYETRKVTLSFEDVTTYLEKFRKIEELIGTQVAHRTTASLRFIDDLWKEYPVHVDSLGSALTFYAIAQVENEALCMYPIRSINGDVIATVTYYGAISSSCKNQDIAYAFLRLFLTEEYQWELSRPQPATQQYEGLIERSWPVRIQGSAEALWKNLQKQSGKDGSKYSKIEANDESIPILSTQIDVVRFPCKDIFRDLCFSSYSSIDDIKKAAEQYLSFLQAKLDE